MFMLSIENSKISIATTFEKKKKLRFVRILLLLLKQKKSYCFAPQTKHFEKEMKFPLDIFMYAH